MYWRKNDTKENPEKANNMDWDLAWVNGKSGRQSWRYADAFQRCITSEAIYHLFYEKQR